MSSDFGQIQQENIFPVLLLLHGFINLPKLLLEIFKLLNIRTS